MNKLFLIKHQESFQGEKYLSKNKNYFEGWYFKNTNNKEKISFIPGINIDKDKNEKKAFIQIITEENSYFIDYDITDFKYDIEPFKVQIANNIFTKDMIHIDIKDKSQKIEISGDLKYSNLQNISTNTWSPNIMGPFSYIPFMECSHAILSMKNDIQGNININGRKSNFNNGIGYIEKDWGCSFPKQYIWCQGNNFSKSNSSFMLAIADIPFKIFNFRGLICDIMIDNEELKFTTYNNSKIEKYEVKEKTANITLCKNSYILDIKIEYDLGNKLLAPVKGKMSKNILESISSVVTVILKHNSNIIFKDVSKNCGLEIVK